MKHAPLHDAQGRVINALSIDVEDWFQVQAMADHVSRARWDDMERRVEANTHRLLDLFAAAGVKATFFTLGWIADRHPGLIRRMAEEGHEVASHGYAHQCIDEQDVGVFRDDVRRARAVLQDASGQAVEGYRAPTFSLNPGTLWAADILSEEGHTYSSSVNPVRHDLYGMPEAPRHPFLHGGGTGLPEFPMTTLAIGKRNIPASGGGWFRLMPYAAFRSAQRKVNRDEGRPTVFYLHPWEIDPCQPRVRGLPRRTRFRHYLNLRRTEERLMRLLEDFAWDRMDRVLFEGEERAVAADAAGQPGAATQATDHPIPRRMA